MNKLTQSNKLWATISATVLALALAGAAVLHSKKAEAADFVQPQGTAEFQVTDKDGTRRCDIYVPANDATTLAKVKAYAQEKGCQIKSYFHQEEKKEQAAIDEPATLEQAVGPRLSSDSIAVVNKSLNVAPATK